MFDAASVFGAYFSIESLKQQRNFEVTPIAPTLIFPEWVWILARKL